MKRNRDNGNKARHSREHQRQVALQYRPDSETELLRRVFNSAKEAIFILDAQNPPHILNCNHAASSIFGYEKSEMLGKTTEFLHVDNQSLMEFQTLLYPAMEQGFPFELQDFKMRRKDGSIFPSEHSVSQLLNDSGARVGWVSVVRDLTQHKLAAQRLQLQSAITENMLDGAVLVRAYDGTIVYANQRFEQMFGYESGELVGKNITVVNAPTDNRSSEDVAREIVSELKKSGVWSGELLNIRKDGSRFWCKANVSTYDSPEYGTIWVSTHEEITERKRVELALRDSEQKLRESEEKYRAIVENSPDMISIAQGGVLRYVNKAMCRKLGWTIEEMTSPSFNFQEKIIAPQSRDIIARNLARRLNGEHFPPYEASHITRDGAVFPTIVRGERISYLGEPADAVAVTDITERKKMEEELRESESRFRSLTEHSLTGIYIIQDGRFTYVNRALANIFGYTPDELIGSNPLMIIHSDDQALVTENIQRRIVSETDTLRYEFRGRRKDGGVRYVEAWGSRVDLNDRPAVIGNLLDVTERKKAGEKLRIDSENLEATVTERTKELRSAKEQLERVIEFNPAVIYIAKLLPDLRMEVTYMSKNMISLSGFEAENFVGPTGEDFWEKRVHPEDLPNYRSQVPMLQDPKQKQWFSEYRFLRRDGAFRWIREEFNVVRDSTGNIVDLIGLWTDVTDRKRAEELEEKRKAELSKKLSDITDRLQSLTKTRDSLKSVPDIGTGLDTILETVLWDFDLDCGAVLVLDRKRSEATVRASKARTKELFLNESYPLEKFVELNDLQVKSITKTVGQGERSILDAKVVHVIPIRSAAEIYGVLALGNEKSSLEEGEVRILELYAELAYSLMMEKSMSLTPVLESKAEHQISSLASNIELGEMYLFKKNPEDAFDVFTSAVFAGHEGLCITRTYPPKVRTKYGLKKTPIIWLTNEAVEGEQCVHSIQDLSILVGDYLAKAEKAVVLIDGFEYLMTNQGFDSFLKFLQTLKNRIQIRNGIILASVFEQAVTPRELALIEREMQVFGR